MAVAHDASSESHTGTTGSQNEGSFSWTHTPVGTPKGVLVCVQQNFNDGTDYVSSVTYGGVSVPAVAGGTAADTATETMRVKAFFLGNSIPTGAQTVTVTRTNNTTVLYAVAATQTAGRDTEVYEPGIVRLQGDGTLSEQSVTDGSTGVNSLRYAFAGSGLDTAATAGANSTLLQSIDYGTNTVVFARETTAGQGSRSVGFSGGSDDRAAVHFAIRENVVTTSGPTQSLFIG